MMGGQEDANSGMLADINITPLVDVMLVLMIIFMVTAPLLTASVNVDLPKAEAAPAPQDDKPLTVSVNAEGKIYLQDEQIELPELVAKLQAISQGKSDKKILVRGDKGNSYGTMLQVMATITQGGFTHLALLSDPSGGAAAKKN